MVKKIALVCCLLLAVSACAFAYDDGSKDLKVSTGFLTFSDNSLDDFVGSAFALNAEKVLNGDWENERSLSVGYATASGSSPVLDVKVTVVPLMYGIRKELTPDADKAKFYAGAGAGLVYSQVKETVAEYSGDFASSRVVGPSTSYTTEKLNAAFQLLGGVEFGSSMFAQIKYLNGGEDFNTGWELSLGAKF